MLFAVGFSKVSDDKTSLLKMCSFLQLYNMHVQPLPSTWNRDQRRYRAEKGPRSQVFKNCQGRNHVREFKLNQQTKPTSAATEGTGPKQRSSGNQTAKN